MAGRPQKRFPSEKGKKFPGNLVWAGSGLLGVSILIVLLMNLVGLQPAALLRGGTDTPQENSTASPEDSAVPLTITPDQTESGTDIYVAQEGDTFSTIAEQYQVDEFALLMYNASEERLNLDLANPILSAGDEVVIPSSGSGIPTPTQISVDLPAGTPVEYLVFPGDTISSVASALRSTTEDILENNNLVDENSIYPGQILQVRVNLVASDVTQQPEAEVTPAPEIPHTYTVKPGEYIICLAIRFNIDFYDLLAYNDLDADAGTVIGDTIKIPQDARPYQGERRLRDHPATYTVGSGENIYEIACLFGDVYPEQIFEANNITPGRNPYTGQKLEIP